MTGVDKIRRALDLRRAGPAHAPTPAATPAADQPALFRDRHRESPAALTRTVAVDPARLRNQRILAPDDSGPVAQAFKILRTQVLQLLGRGGLSSLAVMSPTTHDGRTVTAINLAASIADDPDHTALLVDLDLRRPSVHERFGLRVERGVENCLLGTAEVAEVMVQPGGYRKLALLPAAGPVAGSAELLAAASTQRATREINARYSNRVVIYDLPPVLETADALAFLPCVDAVLLIACEGRTRREDVVRCLHMLRDTPVVGTVLNGSRESRGL